MPTDETASSDLIQQYRRGVRDFSGQDLSDISLPMEDLKECNFSDCVFENSILGGAKFDGSDFSRTTFIRCNVLQASFIDCNFSSATLKESAFDRSDFFNASFTDAWLTASFQGAFFVSSEWNRTKAAGARFDSAVFGMNNISLSAIVSCSFASIRLAGPCSIDASTVRVSMAMAKQYFARQLADWHRDSPEVVSLHRERLRSIQQFFLAAGFDRDRLNQFSGDLGILPGSYATTFISYSSVDEEFAAALWAQLDAVGIETWFAPHDMQGGRTIIGQVSEAIESRAKMILILSDASMQSNWVATEIRKAMDVERDSGQRRLFPIRIVDYSFVRGWRLFDSDAGQDLARLVREYYIPDFSGWQDGLALGQATTRLISDLRIGGAQ